MAVKDPHKTRRTRRTRPQDMTAKPKHFTDIKKGRPFGLGGPDDEMVRQAYVACGQLGCTNQQLADLLGIPLRRLDTYLVKYPDFREAVLAGRDLYDTKVVERSMRLRAKGFKKTVREHRVNDKGEVTEIEKEIYMPPDTKAGIFWLTKRHPDRWGDNTIKKKVNINVNMQINEDPEHTAEVAKILMESGAVGLDMCQLSDEDRIERAKNVSEIIEQKDGS